MKFLNDVESANRVLINPITSLSATQVQGALEEILSEISTHKANNGTDHSYINQSVTTTSTPSFNRVTVNTDGSLDVNAGNTDLNFLRLRYNAGDTYGWYWKYRGDLSGNDNRLELWSSTANVYQITQDGVTNFTNGLQLNGTTVSVVGHTHSIGDVTSGVFPVGRGGTGSSSHTLNKILIGNGTSAIKSDTNLHWDDTNDRLGIGTATPAEKVHAQGNVRIDDSAGNTGFVMAFDNVTKSLQFNYAG